MDEKTTHRIEEFEKCLESAQWKMKVAADALKEIDSNYELFVAFGDKKKMFELERSFMKTTIYQEKLLENFAATRDAFEAYVNEEYFKKNNKIEGEQTK